MSQSTSVKSFEEVYKTAYSHGLENIYALENVDIKTVRPLGEDSLKPQKKIRVTVPPSKDDQQLNFDFGMSYRRTMDHFVLKEPIQILGLTRYIENALLGHGKKNLNDLLNNQNTGFGQGHIDEIQNKLNEYLAGRHLVKTRRIDYIAWLKSVTADIDKKKLYVALEPYGLQTVLSLSTGEGMEIKRLTLEKRMEWHEQAENLLKHESKKHSIDKDMCEICEVFIKPWMDYRQGLSTESELQERMHFLSECDEAESVLEFFTDTYFKGAFPLNRYLEPVDAGVFASAGWIADQYDRIAERARTYFCKPDTVYSFASLVGYLEREFASEWIGFPPGFLEKVLKVCPTFHVHKNHSGILQISLA